MLQTQKGPRKENVYSSFLSVIAARPCFLTFWTSVMPVESSRTSPGSSQAAVLHQHGSSKFTRCHGWSFGSVSLRTAEVEHPNQSENFAQPTSRNNEESAIKPHPTATCEIFQYLLLQVLITSTVSIPAPRIFSCSALITVGVQL